MSTCAKCSKPLTLEIEPDSDNEEQSSSTDPTTVPDDVQLSCGDHFHWQCLLEAYDTSRCPVCDGEITSEPSSAHNQYPPILVNLHNEGGLQEGLDIFPLLQESQYLRAYPEERKARAFLEFCREGDHRAIIELLHSCEEDSEDENEDEEEEGGDVDMTSDPSAASSSAPRQRQTPAQILRYQDPIGSQASGLHAAAANGHREVAWLLLLLASTYPELDFPALVFQEAASNGIMRDDQDGLVDIRSLRDTYGRTAEEVAVQEGGIIWNGWIGNGRLAMP
jgi:hypothetical protein